MPVPVLFVSLNQTYDPSQSIPEIEPWVERAWALTVTKASSCDRVIAVFQGMPLAAWRLRGAFATDETYNLSDGSTRPRVGLSLGDPLPMQKSYLEVPALRRGVAVVELDVAPLAPER
ncbi:hypothetical protein ACFPIJ_47185 [Dactylosporangium cerinum]|uniref:Uncharacterized protein n=1 Tax=Dactylosporangium cerinum TaxID=1434730 RepID=A0ABV9WBR8_9ACTN